MSSSDDVWTEEQVDVILQSLIKRIKDQPENVKIKNAEGTVLFTQDQFDPNGRFNIYIHKDSSRIYIKLNDTSGAFILLFGHGIRSLKE